MKRVAIIGGGLAGTSLAFSCLRNGLYPIIFEANPTLASAASGNFLGIVNPRFFADIHPQSEYFSIAFQEIVAFFEGLELSTRQNIEWKKCGALHLITDDKKYIRFKKMLEGGQWESKANLVSKQVASEIAGIALKYDALYLKDSGFVSPHKLCNFYAQGVEVFTGVHIDENMIADLDADIVVLANSKQAGEFSLAQNIPLNAVRGQITKVKANARSSALKCNLNYGGYCTPSIHGEHVIGATFQRWLDHDRVLQDDDTDNLNGLYKIIPELNEQPMPIVDHRAGIRCSAKDYFPVVGFAGNIAGKKIYMSVAHGSHGIVSSHLAAKILIDVMLKRSPSVSPGIMNALSPHRFL